MRKTIAAIAAATIVLGGFAAALIVQSPATAQESTTEDVTPDRPAGIDEVLSDLVDEGVITQEQADRVAAALRERLGEFRPHRGGLRLEAAAEAIGIEVADLMSALRGGQTIAEVAEANGVDAQAVIDALVGQMNDHLDQAVEDGRITAEQAEEMRADAAERIAAMVNGEFEAGFGPGFRGHHHHGMAEDTATGTGV